MSVSKELERLLRIRGIEEEQRRLQLESVLARRQTLERAREAACSIVRVALPYRPSNLGEILPSMLEHQFEHYQHIREILAALGGQTKD